MSSNDDIARKVRRISALEADKLEVIAIVLGIGLACILLYFVVGGAL